MIRPAPNTHPRRALARRLRADARVPAGLAVCAVLATGVLTLGELDQRVDAALPIDPWRVVGGFGPCRSEQQHPAPRQGVKKRNAPLSRSVSPLRSPCALILSSRDAGEANGIGEDAGYRGLGAGIWLGW